MNNDNDLNLHSMTKLSGWLRYWFDLGFSIVSVMDIRKELDRKLAGVSVETYLRFVM